jgi:hypothetical protein
MDYVTHHDLSLKPVIQDSIWKKIFNISKQIFYKIFPNPVLPGATLHIEWKESNAGNYDLQLLNLSGQIVYTKQMWIDEEARLLELQMPAVPAGTYFLSIFNSKTAKGYTKKVVIQ